MRAFSSFQGTAGHAAPRGAPPHAARRAGRPERDAEASRPLHPPDRPRGARCGLRSVGRQPRARRHSGGPQGRTAWPLDRSAAGRICPCMDFCAAPPCRRAHLPCQEPRACRTAGPMPADPPPHPARRLACSKRRPRHGPRPALPPSAHASRAGAGHPTRGQASRRRPTTEGRPVPTWRLPCRRRTTAGTPGKAPSLGALPAQPRRRAAPGTPAIGRPGRRRQGRGPVRQACPPPQAAGGPPQGGAPARRAASAASPAGLNIYINTYTAGRRPR